MRCPACRFDLEAARADAVDYHQCPVCAGILVATLKSLPLWRALEDAGIDDANPPSNTPSTGDDCPHCKIKMEPFGYMGTATTLFRCNDGRLLFVPGPLQQQARNVWRKQQGRIERRLKERGLEAEEELRATPGVGHGKNGTARFATASVARVGMYKQRAARLMSEAMREDDTD